MLIRGGAGFGIILFAFWVYCLFDVILAEEYSVRNLSKGTWIVIVLFGLDVGAIAWFVAGRPQRGHSGGLPYKGNSGRPSTGFPEYDRPGRFTASNPDDDEAFLRSVRERAEEQRRLERERRKQRDEE